jgi:hypothetical protein
MLAYWAASLYAKMLPIKNTIAIVISCATSRILRTYFFIKIYLDKIAYYTLNARRYNADIFPVLSDKKYPSFLVDIFCLFVLMRYRIYALYYGASGPSLFSMSLPAASFGSGFISLPPRCPPIFGILSKSFCSSAVSAVPAFFLSNIAFI